MEVSSLLGWFYRVPMAMALTLYCSSGATLLVWQESPNPVRPYTNWSAAARSIQDAVDAAEAGDTVLVTNGVYASGGRVMPGVSYVPSRVAVDKPIVVQSVNGPEVTVIEGAAAAAGGNGPEAMRCVLFSTNAVLSGFTLRNGHTWTTGLPFSEQSGGGLFFGTSGVASNCVVLANSANGYGGGCWHGTFYNTVLASNSTVLDGGALFRGTAYYCTMTNNFAGEAGGACYISDLENCTVSGNSSWYGGGIFGGVFRNGTIAGNAADYGGGVQGGARLYNGLLVGNTARVHGGGAMEAFLYNCTVTGNSAAGLGGGVYGFTAENCILYFNSPGNYDEVTANYCCTTPLPAAGIGNIDANPNFVDPAAGNFHLAPGSPCIDAGTNLSLLVTNDLEGNPRPLDGNGDGTPVFDIGAYEFRAAPADSDGDGVPDAQDQCPGTAPGVAVDAQGCSIAQLVPCEGPRSGGKWRDHGEYVSSVVKTVRAFEAAGRITSAEGEKITVAAARSSCGKDAGAPDHSPQQ